MATPTRRVQHKDAAGLRKKKERDPEGPDRHCRAGRSVTRRPPRRTHDASQRRCRERQKPDGLQSLLHGAGGGEPGILVLFEERAAAVRQNARSLGWDLASLERKNRLYLMDARLNPEAVISGDFSIKGLLAILDHQVKAIGARRIVIDAVDTLLYLYDSPMRERQELYMLHEWLLDRGLTTIMTVKTLPQERGSFPVCISGLHGGLCDSRRPARHGSGHNAPIESGQVSWFGIWPQ